MKTNENRFSVLATLLLIIMLLNSNYAGEMKVPQVNGAYLGVFNSLHQKDRLENDPRRTQFDFAANVDLDWQIHPQIQGKLQMQMSAGEGSLGFAGSSVTLTDLNLQFKPSQIFSLTAGSFDTPFGADTPYLTNNADASANPFILNSLFYGAFAGTNVGTLNALGLKADLFSKYGDFTAAITNGTDEAAFNPDGNFEFVISALSPSILNKIKLGTSFIFSKDSTVSGESGSESDFSGWLIDGIYNFQSNSFIKVYYGNIIYGDDKPQTKDDVNIWKIESKYSFKDYFFSGRVSAWEPDDDNADGSGISSSIPQPGFANPIGNLLPVIDQTIHRYQAGIGWNFSENLILKGEWFLDDYQNKVNGKSFNVNGIILTINSLF